MKKRSGIGAALLLGMSLIMNFGSALAQEGFWPQVLEGEKGTVTIYQPQLESFQEDILESRAAVAVQLAGSKETSFGAMWFRSRLLTDRETMTATLDEVKVIATKFPDLDSAQVERLSQYLEEDIPQWDLVISLDSLLADLAQQEEWTRNNEDFNLAPPKILYRPHSAVLVLIDGNPKFQPMENTKLDYLANSAFFIVRPQGEKTYYLRGAGFWFTTTDLTGAWTVTDKLPGELQAISQQIEEDEKKQAAEMVEDVGLMDADKSSDDSPPEVVVSTEPAELIFTTGAPDFASVADTQLLYLRNTDSDVLMDITSQEYFILLAGRWYSSKSLENGPWKFVEYDNLPADFAKIPEESDMSNVRASVAGTQEAREAVLDNQIPQTAEVDRKTAKTSVSYDGDPKFESCGAGVSYALNTDKSVLLIDGTYYCCDEAIWFVAKGPEGPWSVATELPAKIQDLPPECPVYNVKYVTIYESTPEVVYVGYTPGYYGSYVYGPCVIYGTGWYYRPWYGRYYYPRPVTYGFGVHYSPYSGWGFTFGISYGWLRVGVGWGRPPYYGMWGAGGYRYGYRHGYMHGYRHGYHAGYRQGARAGYHAANRNNHNNIYRDRNNGVKHTGGDRRPNAKEPRPANSKNNVYTDRDGNVYRDQNGKWEERDKGGWKPQEDRARPETRPTTQPAQPTTRPETRPAQPTTRPENQPSTRPAQPTTRPAQPSTRPAQPTQQLNRDRDARNRSVQRQQQAPPRQPQQRQAPQSRPSGGGARRR